MMVYSEEVINNEEDIIAIIKFNDLNKIKKFFKYININHLCCFKNILFYLIKENYSYDIFKYFIEQQQNQQNQKQQQQYINYTELLFYSIECSNYEIAKLLIKCGTRIDNLNSESKNIIEYLIEKRKLDSENFLFVLNITKDSSLITPKVLSQLIQLKDFIFIKKILQYKYYDETFIINFLSDYNSKTKRSERELQNIVKLNKRKIKTNDLIIIGNYPLLNAIILNNIEIVQLLMKYAKNNNIILKLNEKDTDGRYPLLEAINNNNIEMIKLLMEYANEYNIILEINEKDNDGWFPLLLANADNINNIEIVKLLIKYANEHNIIMEINEKCSYEWSPLNLSIIHNNVEIVKLLMEYADKHNIILEIYTKNKNGWSPLYLSLIHNNVEIIELFIEYTNQCNIPNKRIKIR